jgi:sugar lactone lactonase YvrE
MSMPWSVRTSTPARVSHSKFTLLHRLCILIVLFLGLAITVSGAWETAAAQAKASTTTTIAVTSGSKAVSTVTSGSVVTLTASVNAGGSALTTGQVNFCDATAKYCTDIHLLGTAQLTSAGTAVLKFRPGIGSHSYKAVFLGTKSSAPSASATSELAVTGKYPTTTTIQQSGNPGSYTLTSTVTGIVNTSGIAAQTGTVSFLETTANNSVLATAALGSAASGLSFFNSSNPATVDEPNVVATADFNGDGILDLAVSASNAGQVTLTILLGNGDGTFTATTSPTVGHFPDSIAVADFNGDGIADLAVTSVDDNIVTILLGRGDGTFTAAPNLDTVSIPQSIVTADFNGDGIADLALVNGNSVLIFLGKGDGTFQGALSTPLSGIALLGLAVGDFNGDGIADLAVTNSLESGTVTILLGKGDGTFKASPMSFTTGPSPTGIAVADFNGDGILDLTIADYDGSNNNGVTILIGNGDGTFQAPAYYGPDTENRSLVVADFNGDGIADLAVGEDWSATITILPGKGDGTFETAVNAVTNAFLSSGYIVAADFNGDGIPDLAVPNQDTNGSAAVLLTQPTQTATATVNSISPPGPGPHQVAASYPGDNNYSSSISAPTALAVVVATPVILPASGTYTSVQTVTITDSTPDATIYYSAFGSLTTSGWVQYTGPITVSGEGFEEIQAYATETGYDQSGYATAIYTLNLPLAATPVISLASGAYPGTQTVTISDTQPGTTIYYTTNGSRPTLNSTKYTGAIMVSSSETLVASAIAYGYWLSTPASAQYIIASSSSSFIYTIAGNGSFGYWGDGGQATFADLNHPYGSVTDKAGNLYIADVSNNVVRKVAAGTGVITTIAGDGTAGYSGDGSPATSAELNQPYGLTLDSTGNLYVSDTSNQVIRKIALATGIITTYAGNGTLGNSGDGGAATSASLDYPQGIAVDGYGNLYIADTYNERVRKVFAATGTITTVAGIGSFGYSGDGGPATSAALNFPSGVAVDRSGNLYIADMHNDAIREVNASSGVITTVAGNGVIPSTGLGGYSGDGGPATSAELYWPEAVAVDNTGNFYIADTFNQVIRKVTISNGVINTVAGNGPLNPCVSFGGDGGPATSAALCYPSGLSIDGTGNLYIADTNDSRIRIVTGASAPPTASTAAPSFSASSGTYSNPQTVTLTDATPGAAIYVTMDGSSPSTLSQGYNGPINVSGTVTIKAIAVAPGYLTSTLVTGVYTITSPPTAVITTVAGSGVYGFAGEGGPATSAKIGNPNGTAFDVAGNFYFSDTGNNIIWMLSAKTGNLSVIAGNGTAGYTGDGGPATNAELNNVRGIAVDSAENVYIADTNDYVVRKVTASTGVITTFAGNGQFGGSVNNGDGGPATAAELGGPISLAFDREGNLYIADQYENRVRMVSGSTGIITTVAGNGNYGFSGDGGSATSAVVGEPDALAFDSAGNLYIATPQIGRIRKVTAGTGIITTIAGNGNEGTSGDGGPATSAEIAPNALAVDGAGNVYFSNSPDTVRVVVANTGVITRVVGNGYYGFSGDGGSATVAELLEPVGISFDASGNLYIADASNSRIRKVTLSASAVAATPVFSIVAGTYTAAQTVTITDSTSGATIYYTTDGTTPTIASTLYTGPVTVSSTETINAIAAATGYTSSAVASATYTINLPAAAKPVFSLAAGTYTAVQTVTITDSTAGATIYYTTDGSTPTAASRLYTGPITVLATETIEAITVATGYTSSAVASATYTINLSAAAKPVFSLAAGTYTAAQTVTITDSTAGATIYYTTDGSTPTTASNVYSKPITVAETETVEAMAEATGYTQSAVAMAGYTIHLPGTPGVTITPSSTSITTAQGLAVAVTVNGGSGKSTPTGTVTLKGGSYSAQQTLSSGSTTFNLPAGALPAGSDTLTATYSPDPSSSGIYAPATQTVTVTVTAIGTSTAVMSITPSAQTITNKQAASLTVSISSSSGQPTPTGSVTLANTTYNVTQALTNGTATFTIPAGTLADGATTLAVTYSGDATYGVATGSTVVTVSQVVLSVPAPSPVSPGGNVTTTLTLSVGSTYSGTMNLACKLTASPSGAQSLPTCSLSPTSITLASGGNATSTLTIQTTMGTTAALLQPFGKKIRWLGSGGSALAALLLFGIPTNRRRRMAGFGLLLIIAAIGAVGCGGGGSQNSPPPSGSPATTAGSYTFTVTASDTTNMNIATSATVTVTVQ